MGHGVAAPDRPFGLVGHKTRLNELRNVGAGSTEVDVSRLAATLAARSSGFAVAVVVNAVAAFEDFAPITLRDSTGGREACTKAAANKRASPQGNPALRMLLRSVLRHTRQTSISKLTKNKRTPHKASDKEARTTLALVASSGGHRMPVSSPCQPCRFCCCPPKARCPQFRWPF